MNCKYLKIKLNKKFECKKTNRIINLKDCTNCKYKEYKEKDLQNCKRLQTTANKKIQTKKSKSDLIKSKCDNLSRVKIKKKSSKLSKLERNRYSIFTEDLNTCFYANKECRGSITKHELFSGRNRQRSIKFGYVIPLCEYHHSILQENKEFNQYWHNACREYWLKNYGTLEDFIKIFGRSYKN